MSARQEVAARAVLLGGTQKGLDGRQVTATPDQLHGYVSESLDELLDGISHLVKVVRQYGRRSSQIERMRILRLGSADALARSRGLNRIAGKASLVVTSPPYPGVHVLYHRWQVAGRSETALPYWIADSEDGLGPTHYTMGGRSKLGEERYYSTLAGTWGALRRLLAPGATVVQLVAFANPARQLPRYLDAMAAAGFEHIGSEGALPWRTVPNRRWYYRVSPGREIAREALLVHRLVPRG
jgi:hypothetical protein